MSAGYYNGVAGLRTASLTHEIVANNLANSQTAGFKASRPFIEALEHALVGANAQPQMAGTALDLSPGPLRPTGRALDLSIEGPNLLAVTTENGERYTRNGRLTLDSTGRLVTLAGHPVVGVDGPIVVDSEEPASVREDGSVAAGERVFGRLKIVGAPDPSTLRQEGAGLYATETPLVRVNEPRVHPNHVEVANVDPVSGTVTLIESMRRFEALTRASQLLMGDVASALYEEMSRTAGR